MLALARYTLKGPYQAAAVVGLLAVLSVLIPLMAPTLALGYLAASISLLMSCILVGLIILTQGSAAGLKAILVSVAGMTVVAYDLGNLPEPFAYYTNGMYTVETDDPEVLRRHLERPERVFAVVNGERLDPLPPELRRRIGVIDSTRLSRRQVLLVTNGEHPEATPLPAPTD